MRKKGEYNNNLEILRGFAALLVVVSHLIFHNKFFDAKYFPENIKKFDPPAHLAVLIFFVLSGYVIGINHIEKISFDNIRNYLKKRFLRIYPIYFIAILFGLVVATTCYSLPIIISNFTLSQNIVYPVIWENNPAWSLNYEVLYYLLFIPISFFEIKTAHAFVISITIGILSAYFPINPILSAYAIGFCFWLLGLAIARNFKNQHNNLKIIPLFFYILAIGNILKYSGIINKIFSIVKHPVLVPGKFWAQSIINIDDLIFLPYCFAIILFFSGKDFKYKTGAFIAFQIPLIFVIFATLKHSADIGYFNVGIMYLLISVLTFIINTYEKYLYNVGIWLGSVSYGVYIIHFPMLILFGKISYWSDNVICYIIRIIIFFIFTLFLAWLLEKKIQPYVRSWLK